MHGVMIMGISWFIGGPFLYIAVVVFLYKTVLTVWGYITMPRHLRWDIYPVPHQGRIGSKYQQVDFTGLKPPVFFMDELKEMLQEMLFIKRAWVNNPRVWKGSFPLHMGFYFGFAWIVLIAIGAVFELNGLPVAAAAPLWGRLLFYLTLAAGSIGFAAGLGGSLVLLWLRTTDEDMRYMSDYVSYINLGLMILLFGSGLAALLFADPSFAVDRAHMAGLLTLRPAAVKEPLLLFRMLIFGLFLLYLPFNRMMHFVGKYFFYHDIMWDDASMKRGSAMETDVAAYLNYRVTWSGAHVRQGESWLDQVAGEASREEDQNEKE